MRATEGNIAADIRRVARLLGHSPSSVEYMRHGCFHVRTIQKKYKTSWSGIVGLAGLRYTQRGAHRIPGTEELIADLLRVSRLIGHPPTRTEYGEAGRFDSETVKRRSGQRRWEEAVATLTGVDREEVKLHQNKGGKRYRTTGELLARLREISEGLGRAPTITEAGGFGVYAPELRKRVGGKWSEVLAAAGLDPRRRSKPAVTRSATNEEFVEDVLSVTNRLGRFPKMREYETRGRYSLASVRRRLGGWRKVKQIVRDRLAGENLRWGAAFPGSGVKRVSDNPCPNASKDSVACFQR